MNEKICPRCGGEMEPVMFTEREYNRNMIPTGRVRRACSHLECSCCFAKEAVDGEYLAGPWSNN